MKNKLIIAGTIIIFASLILVKLFYSQQFELVSPTHHYFLVKEYQSKTFSMNDISDAFKEIDDLKISRGAIGFFRVTERTDEKIVFQAGFQSTKYVKIPHPDFKLIELNDQHVAINNIKGNYDQIKQGYKDLYDWVEANNLKPDGIPYELYFNTPKEVSLEHLKTQILLPVINND